MSEFLNSEFSILNSITPAWLTSVLRREGVLPRGTVLDLTTLGNNAFNSHVTHLRLSYSADAPSEAPRELLLKRNLDAAWAVRAGAREAGFYRLIGSLPQRLPMIVTCFDAAYDEASGSSHVLLADVSSTHRAPLTRDQQLTPGQNVPRAGYLHAVVAALAGFHAYWWGHAVLDSAALPVGAWRRSQAGYTQETARRAHAWADLTQHERSWFPQQHQRVIDHALAGLPRHWTRFWEQRLATKRDLTIVHGDAYFANFLCPIEHGGATYLIDWQSLEVGQGAEDLVNLCATFWTPAQRAEDGRELDVLRQYHEALTAHGVQDYSWEQLQQDYRLGLIEWLFVPIIDRADGAPRSYWWPKLQNLAAAYQEWGCAELLA